MCWLYSIPNLLVIHYLETKYLSGNNVRIMCERVWRFDQECATKKWLMTNSRVVTCQNETHVWSMQEDEESGQLDHYKTKSIVWPSQVTDNWNSWFIPITKWLTSAPCFAKKWLFTFHLIPYYKYPYTHEM